MTCAELMTKNVAFCSPEDRVDTAATLMRDRNVGVVPVVGPDNRPVGIITDRDLAIGVCADAEDSYYKKLKEIMRSPVVCCHESDDVAAALKVMAEHHIRRVPIVNDEGRLVGIITLDDFARCCSSDLTTHQTFQSAITGANDLRS
jgi:CBS domain-containing protein